MMKIARRMVAGIGEPPHDETVLRTAVALARGTAAELHLVHTHTLPIFSMGSSFGYVDPAQITSYLDATREAFEAEIRRRFPDDAIVCHVELGPAHDAINRHATELEAALTIVGAHRRKGILAGLLGTTAQRVLRGSTMPVLVVRTEMEHPRRILLTGEISALSAGVHERALDLVEELLQPREPSLRSLLVLGVGMLPAPLDEESLQRAAGTALDEFLEERRHRPWTVEPRVRMGLPSEEIVAEAREWEADLVVLGTHGRHGAERLLLGSVAEAALRDLPCNALVVPPMAVAGLTDATTDVTAGSAAAPRPAAGGEAGAAVAAAADREAWPGALRHFTSRNAGRIARMEVDARELGAQVEGENLPFRGVSYDPRDDRIEIMLGGSEGLEHLTHTVSHPARVELRLGELASRDALRIESPDGHTLLTFAGGGGPATA